MGKLKFILLWFFIGIISAYDLSLVIKYKTPIEAELNPMCRYVISHYGLHGFVFLKMVGTITVLGILVLLYLWKQNLAEWVALGVGIAQILVFMFLLFG